MMKTRRIPNTQKAGFILLTAVCMTSHAAGNGVASKPEGGEIEEDPGKAQVLFVDVMSAEWQTNWFLDGKNAVLEHRDGGLRLGSYYVYVSTVG
jgi:hypothetical protein